MTMCGLPVARTILLVDDNVALLRLIKALLEGGGFRVLAADRASEALKMCRQVKIDLLLTDVCMPDSTGPELAMQVASYARDVRVLYMSGSDGESLRMMGFSWIEAGLLRKPFSPADLLNAVDAILDGDLSLASAKSITPRYHCPDLSVIDGHREGRQVHIDAVACNDRRAFVEPVFQLGPIGNPRTAERNP